MVSTLAGIIVPPKQILIGSWTTNRGLPAWEALYRWRLFNFVAELGEDGFLLPLQTLYCCQQYREHQQDRFEHLFLGQYESLRFL